MRQALAWRPRIFVQFSVSAVAFAKPLTDDITTPGASERHFKLSIYVSREGHMTPAIAPPAYQPPTASVSAVMLVAYVGDGYDDLVEEAMDYAPIAPGHVARTDLEDEIWADDDSGPMGF